MSVVTKPSKLTYDKERRTIITQPRQIVWLREVDAGTDNACWVVCAKGDAGAWAFVPLRVGAEQPNLRGS